MAISIYQYPQVLHLTVGNLLHNCERTGTNMIVSQHYTNSLLRLFRNTDQRIDLLLKDWDRRPVKFEEYEELRFKLFDRTHEVMEKEAELIDFDRGHYVLEFTADELGDLPLGDYTWCITVNDTENDTVRMLWTNQDYGAAAPAKVIEGPLPTQAEAQAIDPDDLTLTGEVYISSALIGAATVNNNSGVHSLVLVLDDYSGVLTVDGSLDLDNPATEQDWTEVKVVEYDADDGTKHISVVGNYHWLRLSFTEVDGLTSISYRNA